MVLGIQAERTEPGEAERGRGLGHELRCEVAAELSMDGLKWGCLSLAFRVPQS